MSLYDIFETDPSTELDGFELILLDGDIEICFILARAGGKNKRFTNRLQALLKPYERAMATGSMNDDKAASLLSKALAETVIQDWKNVVDREGNPLPFTAENASALLIALPDLRSIIFEESQKAANFIAVEVEEASDF